MMEESSPVVLIRAEVRLNFSCSLVLKLIHDIDERRKYDDVLSEIKIIDKISAEEDFLYSFSKSPMGVSHRDFVQKRILYKDLENWDYVLALENAHHKNCPVKKGVIRADNFTGYLIKKVAEAETHLILINQTDIKGLVPNWIVNMVASKAPLVWINKLEKGLKSYAENDF